MLLQLFEHNEKAYRSAVQMMEECGKAAIVHPTGTGKSYIAFKLIEEHTDFMIVVAVKNSCMWFMELIMQRAIEKIRKDMRT